MPLSFIGQSSFNSTETFEGTTVGGLSGITYDAANNTYYAISDSRNNGNGSVRFYSLDIDLSVLGASTPGAVDFTGVRFLADQNGTPFAANVSDTEGIALTSGGNVFISSEGISPAVAQPFINRFDILEGLQNQVLAIPEKFEASADTTFGIRDNRGFESLTITPDEQFLFTATENALEQDGAPSTFNAGSACRILSYDLTTNSAGAEYLYNTDNGTGISEILAIDENTLLVMERSVVNVLPSLKLYQVSLSGATDISAFDDIDNAPGITPVQKTLVADLRSPEFSSLGFTPDNFEGMTFGPTLADGSRSLILISDNNFGQYEGFGNLTRIAAFEFDTNPLQSSVTTTLPASEANLTLTGTDNINGIGNELDNIIAGNDANNTLRGRFGNDTLLGNAGSDRIVGGLDNDLLTGGEGADRFFRGYSTTGVDTITDFQVNEDKLCFSASGFGGELVGHTMLSSAQFAIGSIAADTSDRFIYDSQTGSLFFDADGTGAIEQVQVATLSTGLAMTHNDIFIFA
jgi:3-phytase/alkaline phosphatase D